MVCPCSDNRATPRLRLTLRFSIDPCVHGREDLRRAGDDVDDQPHRCLLLVRPLGFPEPASEGLWMLRCLRQQGIGTFDPAGKNWIAQAEMETAGFGEAGCRDTCRHDILRDGLGDFPALDSIAAVTVCGGDVVKYGACSIHVRVNVRFSSVKAYVASMHWAS